MGLCAGRFTDDFARPAVLISGLAAPFLLVAGQIHLLVISCASFCNDRAAHAGPTDDRPYVQNRSDHVDGHACVRAYELCGALCGGSCATVCGNVRGGRYSHGDMRASGSSGHGHSSGRA